jgi:hypothetical protein
MAPMTPETMTMLVIEGLLSAKKGLATLQPHTAEGPRVEMFFGHIAEIVNKQVLGTASNSTEWECAIDDKRQGKKPVPSRWTMCGRRQPIIARLELLIEECIIKEEDKTK